MHEKRINILIIAKFFPPVASVATQRIHAIAKYLDKDKFQVHVLTPTAPGAEKVDGELREKNIFVHRVTTTGRLGPANFNGRENFWIHKLKAIWNRFFYALVLDPSPDFTHAAIVRGRELILHEKIEIVFASYAPISCLMTSMALKKDFPKLIHVCDFRDEIQHPPHSPKFIKKKMKALEKEILNSCDLVTSVSAPILEDLQSKAIRGPLFLEINNGYDFTEVIEGERDRDVFRLLYTGTFYGNINPQTFFQALIELQSRASIPPIKIDIYGASTITPIPSALKGVVQIHQKVAYKEIQNVLRGASAFLLILPARQTKGIYSGKLFDYLAVNRPILALVDPTDVAAELIRNTHSGYVAAYDSVAQIQKSLLELIHDWQNQNLPQKKWNSIYQFRRSNQVQMLERALLGIYREADGSRNTES